MFQFLQQTKNFVFQYVKIVEEYIVGSNVRSGQMSLQYEHKISDIVLLYHYRRERKKNVSSKFPNLGRIDYFSC